MRLPLVEAMLMLLVVREWPRTGEVLERCDSLTMPSAMRFLDDASACRSCDSWLSLPALMSLGGVKARSASLDDSCELEPEEVNSSWSWLLPPCCCRWW